MADKEAVLRLRELVEQLARELGLSTNSNEPAGQEADDQTCETCAGGRHNPDFCAGASFGQARLGRALSPPLPDPRLVRKIIRQRQLRARHFDGELFSDPAWDILLDLTAARAEYKRVCVTSACIASGVPPATALRWIKHMVEIGLLERENDESDRRRTFLTLTSKAVQAMARYFADAENISRNSLTIV
jgi:DNA-binding MarR family transcriptional regulator